MRLFAAVLALWYVALSVTPQAAVPSGLGVSVAHQRGPEIADAVLDELQPSVWMNWVYDHMSDARYLPMAYSANPAYLQQYIDAALDSPGRTWLLMSEPECCGTQTSPAVAATFARRWQAEVGGNWACCGTTTWAGWQQWMDGYVKAGGPEPPLCHFHLFADYATPEVGFIQGWLDGHGWECELIISEAAVPWGTLQDNMHLMGELAQLVADGRIRAALWYSAPDDYHGLWPTTDLMTHDATALTPLGEHWLSLQPGGANDPTATLEPVETPDMLLWLPYAGRGD